MIMISAGGEIRPGTRIRGGDRDWIRLLEDFALVLHARIISATIALA